MQYKVPLICTLSAVMLSAASFYIGRHNALPEPSSPRVLQVNPEYQQWRAAEDRRVQQRFDYPFYHKHGKQAERELLSSLAPLTSAERQEWMATNLTEKERQQVRFKVDEKYQNYAAYQPGVYDMVFVDNVDHVADSHADVRLHATEVTINDQPLGPGEITLNLNRPLRFKGLTQLKPSRYTVELVQQWPAELRDSFHTPGQLDTFRIPQQGYTEREQIGKQYFWKMTFSRMARGPRIFRDGAYFLIVRCNNQQAGDALLMQKVRSVSAEWTEYLETEQSRNGN